VNTQGYEVRNTLKAMQQRTLDLARELERELLSVRTAYRKLGQRASVLANERDSRQSDLEQARGEIESVRGELTRLRDEEQVAARELESKLQSEQGLRGELQQQLDGLKAQHDEKVERIGTLEREIQILQEDIGRRQGVEDVLNERNNQFAALEQTVQQLRDDLQSQQGREQNLNVERDQFVQQIANLEQAHAQTRANHEALSAEFENARRTFDQSSAAHADQVTVLEQRINEITAERDALAQQLDELENSLLQATTRQIEELEQTLKHAREAVGDVDTLTGSELDAEVQRARDSEVDALKAQLEQVIGERDAAVGSLNQSRDEISKLRTTTENLLHEDTTNQHGFLGAIIGALMLGLLIGSGISWMM